MSENNHNRNSKGLEVPPELLSALKRSSKSPIFIPATVDETIIRAARQRLSERKEWSFTWPRIIRWSLATAALAILLAVMPQLLRKSGTGSAPGGLVAGDLNHDGQVDILDAFTLAKELKAQANLSPQWDINGDGVVDERDVAALAARAVKLAKGGRS